MQPLLLLPLSILLIVPRTAATLLRRGPSRANGTSGRPYEVLPAALEEEQDAQAAEDAIAVESSGSGSFVSGGDAETTTPWPSNPKNGTPWHRLKKKDDRGQSSHAHFEGLTAEGNFPEDTLHAHNVVRKRAGIPPMKWSHALAAKAWDRVGFLTSGGCYIRHASLDDRWNEAGFEYVGENLYKVINMNPTGVDIVDCWYAEIDDYTYGPVGSSCTKAQCAGRSSPPCTLGHFTQVMWAQSTELGCARQQCPGQAKETWLSVCYYGPGGNRVGMTPFSPTAATHLGLAGQSCR